MSKRLLFIFNPRSGRGQIRTYLADIVDIMVKAGYDVTIYTTQSQGDAEVKAAAEAKNYDLIVCSGGDGTLDEVVSGVMQSDIKVPIGYIPAGSTNDFGSSLGIDKDMLHAADISVNGRKFPCDIGYFNGGSFVYVAAFGIFTEVSYATSQDLKNSLGHVAYILEGAKQLLDIPSFRMQVEYEGNSIYEEFIYGMVTNSESVGGFKGLISDQVGLDDGIFEVTLVKMPKNPFEVNEILSYIAGINRETSMVLHFQTSEIKFSGPESVPWTLDGEFGGEHKEVEIRNCHHALEIMVE